MQRKINKLTKTDKVSETIKLELLDKLIGEEERIRGLNISLFFCLSYKLIFIDIQIMLMGRGAYCNSPP